jgi:pimeloyl-ACP methyl ester carboxylesterase
MSSRLFTAFLLATLAFAAPAGAQTTVDGRFGPGALYRLVLPPNWNGDLVLYAHGDVSSDAPIALPPEADILVALLAPQGYALAYSSFSENGWAVKDGAQRTHQLLGIFTSKFGRPSRVYAAGASMGGLIAIDLVERFPGEFAGALPACAVAGGTRAQFDYGANVRALFDVLYPNALPGNAASVPPGTNSVTDIFLPAVAAMTASPVGAFTMAPITQTPVPFADPAELILSVATALSLNASGQQQLAALTNGKPTFDNSGTVYSGALPPATLLEINAKVGRFTAAPSALQYMQKYYEPSGDLLVPMLMLSDARDPVVPGFHQTTYAGVVAGMGRQNFLVQRQVPTYGHCVFTPAQLGTAFADLVLWVELGIKPIP